jgi:addiction module RelB/DinJ family antitoxin
MTIEANVKVDEKLYNEAKKIFDDLGLTYSDVINLFLSKITKDKKLPSELLLPKNIEIVYEDDPDYQNILECRRKRENGEECYSLEEVMKEFNVNQDSK